MVGRSLGEAWTDFVPGSTRLQGFVGNKTSEIRKKGPEGTLVGKPREAWRRYTGNHAEQNRRASLIKQVEILAARPYREKRSRCGSIKM